MKKIMFILARIFGKKTIGHDFINGKITMVEMYYWHNKYWVWRMGVVE